MSTGLPGVPGTQKALPGCLLTWTLSPPIPRGPFQHKPVAFISFEYAVSPPPTQCSQKISLSNIAKPVFFASTFERGVPKMGRYLLPYFKEMSSGEEASSVCSLFIVDWLLGSGAVPCPQEAPKHGTNTAAPLLPRLLAAPPDTGHSSGGQPPDTCSLGADP